MQIKEQTHCFYNPSSNEWCEYKWDSNMQMFAYAVYSPQGRLQQGYIGLQAASEMNKAKNWDFIGVLEL